jgi:hypothetical protein
MPSSIIHWRSVSTPIGRPLDLGQLLGRQRRPEILVALADDGQAGLAEGRAMRTVARLATTLRDQGVRAVSAEGVEQPIDLGDISIGDLRVFCA